MGVLQSLGKTVGSLITMPIAIVQDAVTMGGAFTDEHEPYTIQKAEKIIKSLQELERDAEDGQF
jgi:hypothetical protein